MNTKTKKIITLSVAGFFVAILLFSTMSSVFLRTNPTQVTTNSTQAVNRTAIVESMLMGIPNNCYIIYADSVDPKNNDTEVTFYNTTSLPIYNLPQIHQNDKLFTSFMNLPETQLYFFNHCEFFDNKKMNIPKVYNASLGTYMNVTNRDLQMNLIKERILDAHPFADAVNQTGNIMDLSSLYMMTPSEVVTKLFKMGQIDLKRDCMNMDTKGSLALNGTAYDCKWKQSEFYIDINSGQVIPR